ncbi:MAG: topoisomerase DNA-binding C4 zinc finger domain-containing protein, partial [Ignavibacteria bacterium]|nr:topoisomerase DNA-binding C4 zinc finger domain-containing protein [Ignavibacteria bacterium]
MPPNCPICGSPTQLRTARRGQYVGQQFYGCSRYPNCNGIVNIQAGLSEANTIT